MYVNQGLAGRISTRPSKIRVFLYSSRSAVSLYEPWSYILMFFQIDPGPGAVCTLTKYQCKRVTGMNVDNWWYDRHRMFRK